MSQQQPPKSYNKTNITIALISAAATVLAAIIAGLFLLASGNKGPVSSTTPIPVETTTLHISSPTVTPTSVPLPALAQPPILNSLSGNSNPVTFSSPVKPDDLIVVAITQWVGEVSSVTDDRGDRYISVIKDALYATPPSAVGDTNNHDYIELYYAKNVTGGTTKVTVNFTATEKNNVGIYEFSGLDRTNPFDPKEVVSNKGYSSNPNGGTLNTKINNEICFVVGVDDDGNNSMPTNGSLYPAVKEDLHQDDTADHERFYTEYMVAPQGSYKTDFSISTDSYWAVVGAAFKPQPA